LEGGSYQKKKREKGERENLQNGYFPLLNLIEEMKSEKVGMLPNIR